MAGSYIVVLTTAAHAQEAEKIAKYLLEQKLIACANVLKGVESFFWWGGKIDRAEEVLLVMKSRKALFSKITKAVKAVHSYSVPEIIAVPVVSGSKDYLDWVSETTK